MDLTWSLYVPLIIAAALYALITIAAGIMAGRGNEESAERMRDVNFLLLLAAGGWVVVLLVLSVISQPDDIWDMVVITAVIVVFFALLLVVLFGLSLLFGRLGRAASRRRRVTTDEL